MLRNRISIGVNSAMTSSKPRIVLINPKAPPDLWNLSGIPDALGRGFIPNLALSTLAALVPDRFEVEVWDENTHPIDRADSPDIVGITGYSAQADRMMELGEHFRGRGSLVCMGGIHATCASDELRPHADVLFLGEGEHTWPRFLKDYLEGRHEEAYTQPAFVDMADSPMPAVRFMDPNLYLTVPLQTMRGCPFDCEFCAVVPFMGRKLRRKSADTVVEECRGLYQAGARATFIVDDNFPIARKHAYEVLEKLGAWNQGNEEDTIFYIQTSINVASDERMLELAAGANVKTLFIGIETDNQESLAGTGKRQNLERDLVADVHRIFSHGLSVQTGMVIGFDQDTSASFDTTFECIQEIGAPVAVIFPLLALPETKLEARLKAEGRWRGRLADCDPSSQCSTNIEPLGMSYSELTGGYVDLLKRVFSPKAFLHRVSTMASLWPEDPVVRYRTPPGSEAGSMRLKHTMTSLSELGPDHQEAVRCCFRLATQKPTLAYPLFLSLMFWLHILTTVSSWDSPRESPMSVFGG